jgi:hypothetical protein
VADKRTSIQPTYDSRETRMPYHVTTRVDGQTVTFQHRIPDPFVRQIVTVGWRDVARCMLGRRSLVVEVMVSADRDVMEDVLELDGNSLGPNCTRRDEFNRQVGDAIGGTDG